MQNLSFEKAMRKLEEIVQTLEGQNMSLESALKKFEEGIEISKFCSKKLEETEKKITILLADKQGRTERAYRRR
ncbi:MAG: exodeoxyribonuclease VII small subunit [Desulfobacteraceae bacterium]|jgi:exodeoxyribonuclease VII small subunit